ncbi:hypothetical protein LTR37_000778 [Vermiconidia calcicola]|uniref:Uncharacterized protein n=1 Tax=Vermiconidia calcicola TaxID=1690605 RepID=A0ACC3NXX0_9PEZI|nr:hypothetical protein LTR37_000778 [Vermiconidia calcicola]
MRNECRRSTHIKHPTTGRALTLWQAKQLLPGSLDFFIKLETLPRLKELVPQVVTSTALQPIRDDILVKALVGEVQRVKDGRRLQDPETEHEVVTRNRERKRRKVVSLKPPKIPGKIAFERCKIWVHSTHDDSISDNFFSLAILNEDDDTITSPSTPRPYKRATNSVRISLLKLLD